MRDINRQVATSDISMIEVDDDCRAVIGCKDVERGVDHSLTVLGNYLVELFSSLFLLVLR